MEQLIKKKYQAWKLLAIGILLGFTIYSLGKLYRSLRTYIEVSNVEWVGENTVNYPASKKEISWQWKANAGLKKFFGKYHYILLLVYVLTWLIALTLITMGMLKYLNVRQKIDKLKKE